MRSEAVTDENLWNHGFEQDACFSSETLAGALERLKQRPAVSMPILSGPILAALATAAGDLAYRPAAPRAGKPEARVYQQFDYCGAVPTGHPVRHLGRWFQSCLQIALARMHEPPMETGFTINDIVCQRYLPGHLGITPHRDHVAYTGLVTLVVLGGRGRYFVCTDRSGGDRREIEARPGWAILMPGPGYAGGFDRPFHMVGDITRVRYSAGLRHDARKSR